MSVSSVIFHLHASESPPLPEVPVSIFRGRAEKSPLVSRARGLHLDPGPTQDAAPRSPNPSSEAHTGFPASEVDDTC
jgi:hypothetical protein